MSPGTRLLGAALAGGRSRRFGRDKAVEEIDGVSLVERAVRTLQCVAKEVVVISGRALPVDVVRLPDLRIDAGPLAGIETALSRARDLGMDAALVLACDMPLVRATTLRALADAVDGGSVAAAVVAGTRRAPVARSSRCARRTGSTSSPTRRPSWTTASTPPARCSSAWAAPASSARPRSS